MATIEELLGASADDLEKMTPEQRREYLKEIINLEPKILPKPLVSKKAGETDEVDEDADPDGCPIKERKGGKRGKKGASNKKDKANMFGDIDGW